MIGIFGVGIVLVSFGCGQSSTTATTTTTISNTTTTTVAGGVTATSISGSLYGGTVRTSALKTSSISKGVRALADATTPIGSYSVVAVGTVDKKVYFSDAKTSATDGSFSISVPSGESFYLEIIDDAKKFAAPVAFGAVSGGVAMAITPEAGGGAIDLGKVVYESAKGVAVPSLEVAATKLDAGSTAEAKTSGGDFLPVGAGILGRGTGEALFSGTLKDKVDEDSDGLPDVVDIDDDGDGKVDGLDSNPRKAGAFEVKITGVDHTNAFSNLPLNYEDYPTYASGSINTSPINVATKSNLAIEAVMASGYTANDFSSVKVIEGPAWIDTATISGDGGSDNNSAWKDKSYTLYKGTNNDRWTVHVTPNGTPEAGDVLKFKVVRTDGTSQEFISTLTYVFKDIPRLVSYKDGSGTKEGTALNLATYQTGKGSGSPPRTNVFTYEGSSIIFTWTTPRDDLGDPITGMTYYLDGINYYDASGAVQIQAGALRNLILTEGTLATLGPTFTYTFTPTTDAFSYFKVDVKAESPASGGGNASQLIYFMKTP